MLCPDRNQLRFRKSSYSPNGGSCVELARYGERFAVRDSKDPSGPILSGFTTADLHSFVEGVKQGEF